MPDWTNQTDHLRLIRTEGVGPATYRRLLSAAGFEVVRERSRREFAIEFFRQLRARLAQSGPPLGLHILMGATSSQKVANMISLLERGLIAPTELIGRAIDR